MAAYSDKPLQKYKLFAASFVLVLVACAARPVPLNSERIKQRFGSYGVEILVADDSSRISNLFSNEPSGRVCRTYAVVKFAPDTDPAFIDEHAAILSGASLGATFKARGWAVEKQTLHIGTFAGTRRRAQINTLMAIADGTELAMHIYRLLVSKDDERFEYAVIAEVHHPDYLQEQEVLQIYGANFDHPGRQKEIDELIRMIADTE